MAKDPAFLFYSQDFLTGTMFMNNEQVGIYIRLLCAQHQHGGIIDKISFCSMVGANEILKSKFVETDDGFFNERLMGEMEKRSKKSSNLSANAKIRWEKQKQLNSKSNAIASEKDMPIENEDESLLYSIDKYAENFKNDFRLDEKVISENSFNPKQLAQARLEFWNSKELDVEMTGKSYKELQKHFLNWCRTHKVRIKGGKFAKEEPVRTTKYLN